MKLNEERSRCEISIPQRDGTKMKATTRRIIEEKHAQSVFPAFLSRGTSMIQKVSPCWPRYFDVPLIDSASICQREDRWRQAALPGVNRSSNVPLERKRRFLRSSRIWRGTKRRTGERLWCRFSVLKTIFSKEPKYSRTQLSNKSLLTLTWWSLVIGQRITRISTISKQAICYNWI